MEVRPATSMLNAKTQLDHLLVLVEGVTLETDRHAVVINTHLLNHCLVVTLYYIQSQETQKTRHSSHVGFQDKRNN